MNPVKVTINLSEGIIQLEGPQEFVEEYLERYLPLLQDRRGITGTPESENKAAGVARQTKRLSDLDLSELGLPAAPKLQSEIRVRRRARKQSPVTGPATHPLPLCNVKIRELIAEGYFMEARSDTDIRQSLKEKHGLDYPLSVVADTTRSMLSQGELIKTYIGKDILYFKHF